MSGDFFLVFEEEEEDRLELNSRICRSDEPVRICRVWIRILSERCIEE